MRKPIPGCLKSPDKPLHVANDVDPEVTVQEKFEDVNGPPGLVMALASVPLLNSNEVSSSPKLVPPMMSISPGLELFSTPVPPQNTPNEDETKLLVFKVPEEVMTTSAPT